MAEEANTSSLPQVNDSLSATILDFFNTICESSKPSSSTNITCTPEFYYVDMEIPGFDASEINVRFTHRKLIVNAVKNDSKKEKTYKFGLSGDSDVKSEKTTAHLSKGILRVTLARFLKETKNDRTTRVIVTQD